MAAGLDLHMWEQGEYEPRFKARVIAWHRLHDLIMGHAEDASATQSERRAKQARAKRKK